MLLFYALKANFCKLEGNVGFNCEKEGRMVWVAKQIKVDDFANIYL